MLAWSPLLIQKIEIHALGFVLRKLQLNRHRDAEVASHGHAYAQLILYLTGEGVQTVKTRRSRARAGDLFVIPPGAPHGFSVVGGSRPLCLVLDYELEGAARVSVHMANGEVRDVAVLVSGDMVGEMSLMTGAPRTAWVSASCRTSSLRMSA